MDDWAVVETKRVVGLGFGGDSHPGEEPQAKADAAHRDYTDAGKPDSELEKNTWALQGSEIMLGDENHRADAKGTIEIENGWHATFKVLESNLPVKELGNRLRTWARGNGYEFKQLQDAFGNVIPWGKKSSVPGIGEQNPGLMDWRSRGNEGGWSDDAFQRPDSNVFSPASDRVCKDCGQSFSDERDWFVHRLYGHGAPATPVVDLDQVLPANYNEGGRMGEPGITTGSFDMFATLGGTSTLDTHTIGAFDPHPGGDKELWNKFLVEGEGTSLDEYQEFLTQQGRPTMVGIGGQPYPLSPDKHGVALYEKRTGVPAGAIDYTIEHNADYLGGYDGRESLHPDYTGPIGIAGEMYVAPDMRNSDAAARIFREVIQRHPGVPFLSQFVNPKIRRVVERYNRSITGAPPAAVDPAIHHYWEDLSDKAYEVVEQNKGRIYQKLQQLGSWGAQSCGNACDLWQEAFVRTGVSVQQVDGNYHNQNAQEAGLVSYSTSSDHVWLLVDGEIFDPTAGQFGQNIAPHHYRTSVSDIIPGPISWLYDIKGDKIIVGQPGAAPEEIRTPDYNPMGVVEGVYTPKGEMQLVETTNMPITVKHLIRLWYYMHPELEVKRVVLHYKDLDGSQKTRRLAKENIHMQMNSVLATDPAAMTAAHALMPHGNVYVVGGAVRDMALGQTPKDVDLMAGGIHPEKLENILGSLPGRVDFTGKAFGVYRYRTPEGHDVEVALPRGETSTGEGHKDFEVKTDYRLPVEADMDRRDFTGNAMAYDLKQQRLIDPHGGWDDLQNRRLRVVNQHAFRDDPLRILRGLASVSRHGLVPDEHTRNEMRLNAPNLKHLPNERVQAELDKLMGGNNPAGALRLAHEAGVLEHVLPEVAAQHGFDQRNRHHDRELFDHTMEVVEHMGKLTDDKDLRYTALLHDIGKPKSQWINPEGFAHYYRGPNGEGDNHEELGANMSEEAMRRLKFPKARIDRVKHLVHHHMFPEFITETGARKFMNRVGPEHADDLMHMRAADLVGKSRGQQGVENMRNLMEGVRAKGEATTQGNLTISGDDLISMGMPPGPQMGTLLRYLTDLVIENPALNDPEKLRQIVQEHIT